jgi:hypothetical protein
MITCDGWVVCGSMGARVGDALIVLWFHIQGGEV